MEEEIDVENRNPVRRLEVITAIDLLCDYKSILAPQGVKPPTRREETEARKCRRSGMVPGAIRKYLIQKKQHEHDDHHHHLQGGEGSSGSASPSSDSSTGSNNNIENKVISSRSLAPADDSEDEEQDDEIHFLGEYAQPESNILAEINQNKNAEGQNCEEVEEESKDLENAPLDSETEFEEEEETLQRKKDAVAQTPSNNKRRYSQVFSPDSTTNNDTLNLSPEKQSRLERTPSSRKLRTESVFNGSTSTGGETSPIPGPSTNNNPTGDSDEVVIRNKRGQVIGSHVRNIFPSNIPTVPQLSLTGEAGNSKLEALIRKNNWKGVISELTRNLENHTRPAPNHLGEFVKKAILTLGTRVSKEIPALAIDFFKKLVTEYPVTGDESLEYYIIAFTHTSVDASPAGFLFTVLDAIQGEAKDKVAPKALPFFKSLTKMGVNQYKEYIRTHVRLRRPFFVRFLEEEDKVMSYNIYCQKLLHTMFALNNYPDECKTVMRWVGLLADHLRRNTHLDEHFSTLVQDFVKTVSKPEFASCRITLIQSISEKILGAAVCLQLLRQSVIFKTVDTNRSPMDEEVIGFLTTISQSELIAGLKSGLKERRGAEDVGQTLIPMLKRGNKKKDGVNMKGESYLHRLCSKASGKTLNGVGLSLDSFLREKRFPVNPRDNFGNTPLHDAIAHERFDALTKFFEYCSDPTLPDELRIDVLAQNEAGETPFHLAAASKKQCDEMVQLLCYIGSKLQVINEAKLLLNNEGKMPYQLAFTNKSRILLKPKSVEDLPYQIGNIKVENGSRTELQSIHCKRLIALWSEFSCSS